MAYEIIAPVGGLRSDFMWALQDLLRSATFSAWTYVDGFYGGVQDADGSLWDAGSGAGLVNGDYVILHLPAVSSADRGVVGIIYNDIVTGGAVDSIQIMAYPGGWNKLIPGPKVPATTLGDATTVIATVCGPGDVEELRVIANANRAIIWGMGVFSPYYFGYLGFIQSHYCALEEADDPNPLLVTGGKFIPGTVGAPMMMQRVDGLPDNFLVNANPGGFLATDGSQMLSAFQWNRREVPPVPTRTLLPCVIGCSVPTQTEIRGELEGVFYYGPTASLSEDTVVSRSDGLYLVIGDIVTGPVV
jgi:hypothetical protein